MTSLVQHLTDPSAPEPDITHQEMLDTFTRALIAHEHLAPELGNLFTVHKLEDDENVGIVINGDLRGLLYSDISRDHLERMIDLVCQQRIINPEAIRSILDGTTPRSFTDGVL